MVCNPVVKRMCFDDILFFSINHYIILIQSFPYVLFERIWTRHILGGCRWIPDINGPREGCLQPLDSALMLLASIFCYPLSGVSLSMPGISRITIVPQTAEPSRRH